MMKYFLEDSQLETFGKVKDFWTEQVFGFKEMVIIVVFNIAFPVYLKTVFKSFITKKITAVQSFEKDRVIIL